MKTILVMLIFAIVPFTIAQVNSNYDGPKPEVRQDSKSFVFMYTPFQSNFDPVYVSTVSVYPDDQVNLFGAGFRYFFTNQIGVTLGWNFGTASTEQEFQDGTRDELTTTNLGIAIDCNYHFNALYGVSPYIGLNVNYGLISSELKEFDGSTTTTTEESGNGFGAGVNFGFDWYFTEGLSLGGKYTLGFKSIGKPERTINATTVEGQSISTFGIGTASVILNVHI
jgi:hypothetical protein